MTDEVIYLGHRIYKHVWKATNRGQGAIYQEITGAKEHKKLQAFLGMLNYYECYIPRLSTV